ncbi:hypothetical protein N5079_04240 [Planotetraspora sp. A-T 1434]|uniref:hypothetical protein n=1 Tax=Planotetraspora sp. A-T 1434 TaxID=2979219 RepID=UPI0021BE7E74|nr:hypothetical protein [Planotetraspora sp. A-T 1434]MCT9929424.1 hypothetical protein [Planotetraspora sp. A-T 1434]
MRRGEIWQALGEYHVLAVGATEVYDVRDDIAVVPLIPDIGLTAATLPKVGDRLAHCALLSVVSKAEFTRKTGEARDAEFRTVLDGLRLVLGF